MSRRPPPVLVASLAVGALLVSMLGGLLDPATADPGRDRSDGRRLALDRLRADAGESLRTTREDGGTLTFIGAPDGRALDNPDVTPATSRRAAARAHLERYGAALGVDPAAGSASEVVLDRVHGVGVGDGSVARFGHALDGRRVLGSEVVVTMDADGEATSLLSSLSSLSDAQSGDGITSGELSAAEAARTARAVVARAQDVPARWLEVTVVARVVHDPALLPSPVTTTPGEAWQLEVGNGSDVRELVLVDTVTGAVRLHFDQVAEALDRKVCDDANVARSQPVPCTSYARSEGGPVSAVPDVEQAYRFTGATAAMYDDVAGLDLTELIGRGQPGSRVLASTVRSCASSGGCPMANAFWDGTEMHYGEGFAVDDVVGHELTHGVIDRTSQLFYFHQSGAINESLADVFGEIVDRRTARPAEQADVWLLGEEAPGGALRDLSDPTAFGQPDRMTSALYDTDLRYRDNGGVHSNSGVGNKLAHLVAAGGTVAGTTVRGLDADDPGLTKTATLFYATMTTLVSGSDYADLADVVEQRCVELAAGQVAGFTADDCVEVAAAVSATQLRTDPPGTDPGSSQEPDLGCPAGTRREVLLASEQGTAGWTPQSLWQRAPAAGVPANATSGTASWFGWDPDPELYQEPRASALIAPQVTLPADQSTYLAFSHWRLFDWEGTGTYYDGGFLDLTVQEEGTSTKPDVPGLPWVNGPRQTIRHGLAAPTSGFGGDSRGWVTSRVELSSFGGAAVRPSFVVRGDETVSFLGWYLDDVEVYTCTPRVAPSPVTGLTTRAEGSATAPAVRLSWGPPAAPGDGVTGYRVTRSDGVVTEVGAGARQLLVEGLIAGRSYRFQVRPLGVDGLAGPPISRTVTGLELSSAASTTRVRRSRPVTLTARLVRAGTTTAAAARTLTVQFRAPGSTAWRRLVVGTRTVRTVTGSDGRARVTLRPTRTRSYRLVTPHTSAYFAVLGRPHKVSVR